MMMEMEGAEAIERRDDVEASDPHCRAGRTDARQGQEFEEEEGEVRSFGGGW